MSKDDRMLVIGNLSDPPLRHFPNQQSRSTSKPSSNLEHRSILVKCSSSQKGAWHDFYKVGSKFHHTRIHSPPRHYTISHSGYHASSLLSLKIISSIFQDFRGMASCTIFTNRHKSCRRIAWAAMEHALTPFQLMHSNILQDFYAPFTIHPLMTPTLVKV